MKFSITEAELAYAPQQKLNVMNFLNEVAEQFPNAVSFASGRPTETAFDVESWFLAGSKFVDYYSEKTGADKSKVYDMLGQYGKTSGIINDLIARMLKNDEGIEVDARSILVTYGAQEALEILVSTLCNPERDVIITIDPTYIGMTGLAAIKNIPVITIPSDAYGPDLDCLNDIIVSLIKQGKRAAALYVIPDFDNPTGRTIGMARRKELLALCSKIQLPIIEDNPYGLFRYEGEKIPTLKSLDENGVVFYLGTFAKTLCPGLRLGYIVSEHMLERKEGSIRLIDELSKVKSLISVNTGQMSQAMVGGLLLQFDCSLTKHVESNLNTYRTRRDLMLSELEKTFSHPRFQGQPIHWNKPEGGFFLVIELPFEFNEAHAIECAEKYKVICLPLSSFAANDLSNQKIRLSFSYVNSAQICSGVAALGEYIFSRLSEGAANALC